jgi:hypothetical protein
MLSNLLGNFKSLLQSDEKKEAVKKITEAINKSVADNQIGAGELAEIQKLQKDLSISDEEMANIKIKILENLIEKINSDGVIGEDEIKTFNQVKAGLGVDMKIEINKSGISKEDIQKSLLDVKSFLIKVKDKTVQIGGEVIDKTTKISGEVIDKTTKIGGEVIDKTKNLLHKEGDKDEKK